MMGKGTRMGRRLQSAAAIFLGVAAAVNWGLAAKAGVEKFQAQAVNHLETGNTKIDLKEYGRDADGAETEYGFEGEVLPGTYVSKIPRIENLSSDCYIRIKAENRAELCLEDESFKGISEEWIKRGDYWYYQPVLGEGESADFFTGIQFPTEWDERLSGQEVVLSLQAEAIQARNFTPDYALEDPWFGERAQYCLQEFGAAGEGMGDMPMQVIYEEGLSVDPNDFFENLGRIMPGDVCSDGFLIDNRSDADSEIWFRTELPGLAAGQKELLEGIGLSICLGETLLYQGNLASPELHKGVSLGDIKAGEDQLVSFSLSVPAQWDNAYSFRDTMVKWIFETERNTPDPAPDTGDPGAESGWIFFGSGTLSALVLLAVLRRSRREQPRKQPISVDCV